MSGYIGTAPVPQATQTRDSFTATSGQVSFSCSGYTPNFLDVFLNGVKLAAADYTATNGSDVVLASGAATGDILEVVAYTTFTVGSSFTPSIDDNGNATALTIDSSENVLVGKTSSSTTTVGNELRAGGLAAFTRSGSYSLNLNRLASDGDIALFQKDGGTVGSIGIQGTGFYINGEAEHAGIRFGGSAVVPRHNNADSNNYVNLGDSSNRFKDAYLSGGVYLGGTGSANKLDDYEEGSFTPTFSSGFTSISYQVQSGHYVKVGRLVTIQIQLKRNSSTAAGSQIIIAGLPFNASANSTSAYGGFYPNYNAGFNTNVGDTYHKQDNNANISINTNSGSGRAGNDSGISTSAEILLSGSYYTDS